MFIKISSSVSPFLWMKMLFIFLLYSLLSKFIFFIKYVIIDVKIIRNENKNILNKKNFFGFFDKNNFIVFVLLFNADSDVIKYDKSEIFNWGFEKLVKIKLKIKIKDKIIKKIVKYFIIFFLVIIFIIKN